jgi:phosphoribosylformylglycinamidine synthase PurS subunit
VARIVVEVMLKPEILDPQGAAIAAALPRLGFSDLTSVRQGKRFEIEVERAAELLLANLVIENFTVRVDE